MKDSFRMFMKGIIDYAGLFPPAELSLDEAIHNYADYRRGPDAWMLSNFIIPAEHLSRLDAYADELFLEEDPLAFSVLNTGTETIGEFGESLDLVIRECLQFHDNNYGRVATEVLETKVPVELSHSNDTEELIRLFDETAGRLSESPLTPGLVFYEILLNESWKRDVTSVLKAIASHNRELPTGRENYSCAGFKLRCGGVEASMFPGVEQAAFVLNRAGAEEVPVKCTAGLHHPVRLYHDSVKTKMHGFFNIFGGAMLALANDLNDEELMRILEEEDAEAFAFTDEGFSWKEIMISTPKITRLREAAVTSFGSCSFDEPREDLIQLGLL